MWTVCSTKKKFARAELPNYPVKRKSLVLSLLKKKQRKSYLEGRYVNRSNVPALNFSFLSSSWAATIFFTGRIRSFHFVRIIPVRFRCSDPFSPPSGSSA